MINNIFVVNKSNHAPTNNDFYIGRGSVLGNPYTSKPLDNTKAIYQATSREDAIHSFRGYLNDNIETNDIPITNMIDSMLEALKTSHIYLVCYCKPLDCHGDEIHDHLFSKQVAEVMKNLTKK